MEIRPIAITKNRFIVVQNFFFNKVGLGRSNIIVTATSLNFELINPNIFIGGYNSIGYTYLF